MKQTTKRTRQGKELLQKLFAQRKVQEKSCGKSEPSEKSAELVSFLSIDEGSEEQRIDNFLIKKLKNVPKAHIYRILRSGEVRVNKKRVKAEYKLQKGDVVRVPPIRLSSTDSKESVPAFKNLPKILFEDNHLLIVDKPAGIASHGGSGISYGLIERMRASRPDAPFLELVHRLDKETSGIIVLAKSRKALVRMHDMIKEGGMRKCYRALLQGRLNNDRQHIKAPLFKYLLESGERRVRVDPELGSPSHSIFTVLQRFEEVTYVEVELKTGRTHQIRVHSQHIGHPIVGDDKYGDFSFNKEVAKGRLGIEFQRMFLHAALLEFAHPVTGEMMRIECPLPPDCAKLIEVLESRA